jgi:alpha-beta hydrolase superfamily lysophospholipase
VNHTEFIKKSFDGLSLYFQGWLVEGGQKGVICLIHGLGEHSGRYVEWASMLNKVGYSILTYDLRGHGKSAGKRGHVNSFEDYLKDTDILLDVANEKFPGKPRFLYGHSLGGLIAVYYVLKRKSHLNGVVVTAFINKTSLQEQKGKVLLSKVLGSIVPRLTIHSGLVPETLSRNTEVVECYINDPLVHHDVSIGWGKSAIQTIEWVEKNAKAWSLPVLFMHGELDKLGYAEGSREYTSKIMGDCTLKILPGLFHEIHNEPEKDQVFSYLQQWLDEH